EVQVVDDAEVVAMGEVETRSVDAEMVAEGADVARLVVGAPTMDAVAETVDDEGGVVGEPGGAVAVEPAAAVVERLREVPVEQCNQRLNTGGEKRVDETIVEGEAGFVDAAGAVREDARPGKGKPVGLQAD